MQPQARGPHTQQVKRAGEGEEHMFLNLLVKSKCRFRVPTAPVSPGPRGLQRGDSARGGAWIPSTLDPYPEMSTPPASEPTDVSTYLEQQAAGVLRCPVRDAGLDHRLQTSSGSPVSAQETRGSKSGRGRGGGGHGQRSGAPPRSRGGPNCSRSPRKWTPGHTWVRAPLPGQMCDRGSFPGPAHSGHNP